MPSWKQAIVALVISLVTLTPSSRALAESDIPLTPVPISDEAVACTVEPANLDRVLEIAGSAIEDPGATLSTEPPIAGGEIVTGADANAVIELANQMIACLNAVEPARFIGLFSDDFIERAAYDIADIVEQAEEMEASEPDDGTEDIEERDDAELVVIVQTSDVYEQPDGRLAYSATIGSTDEVNSDNIPVPFSLIQIIAVEQRGEWKIDDLRETGIDDPNEPTDCAADDSDGCGAPDEDGATFVEGEGYAGWLMTEAAAAEAILWLGFFDEAAVDPFQPSEGEAAEAEAALPAFIAEHPNATERIIDELHTGVYERQYLGYVTADGAILVINAYCGEPFGDPSAEVHLVEDGGDCYWQATFDLTEGQFTDLRVNGEA